MQPATVELVMKRQNKQALRATQKGVALILMAFVLVLAASAIALKIFDTSLIKARQDTEASISLADAKVALIGYSLGRVGGGERPGDMPRPDYFASTEVPANYDGTSDGGCLDATKPGGLPMINSGTNMRCLGRLPWQTIGLNLGNPTQNDPLGQMPWYAVSANLVDPTCLDLLNPNILNMTYTSYICHSTTNLPHPWLTVYDSRGNVLSSRVAIVLMLPSKPIGLQARPVLPLADVTNYLDSVVVPVGCSVPCVPGTYSNSDFDDDFIMASGLTGANNDQNNQNLASSINDKVLYITIDELMATLTERAAGEARSVLKGYKNQNGSFPYAAPLGSTGSNFVYSGTSRTGMLPIDGTDTCGCSSSTSCTCAYGLVNSVAHTRTSGGNYTITSGLCSGSGTTKCTCTGVGQCRNASGSRTFTCFTGGSCSFSGTGATPTFTYTPRTSHGTAASASGGCSLVGSNVTCNAIGNFYVGLNVPTWFKSNQWQEFFYYRWNLPANLQVGTRTGIEALLIGAGSPIVIAPFASKGSAQARPSALINDYLDSAENTDGNLVFDDTTMPRSASYNDQTFMVYP